MGIDAKDIGRRGYIIGRKPYCELDWNIIKELEPATKYCAGDCISFTCFVVEWERW